MKKLLMLLIALSLAVTSVSAQTVEWKGVNTSAATSLNDIDVYSESLWFDPATETNRLPTSADDAVFNFNSANFARDDLSILPNSDPEGSLFAAKKISMLGYTSTAPLFIRTNLSLESVYLRMGGNWSGGDFNLRVGSAAALAELALRSADVQNIEGGDVKLTGSIGWAMLNLDNLTPHDGTNATRVTRRNEVRQRINDLKLQTGIEAVQPSNWVLGDPTMNMIIRSTTTKPIQAAD